MVLYICLAVGYTEVASSYARVNFKLHQSVKKWWTPFLPALICYVSVLVVFSEMHIPVAEVIFGTVRIWCDLAARRCRSLAIHSQ
jgi:hypothetical protein